MTSITINTDLGGHDAGSTITVTNGAASSLIANGYAEPTEQAETKPRPKGKTPPKTQSDTEGGGASPEEPTTPAG